MRITWSCLLAVAVLPAVGALPTAADDQQSVHFVPGTSQPSLVQRLDAAEQRIRELELERLPRPDHTAAAIGAESSATGYQQPSDEYFPTSTFSAVDPSVADRVSVLEDAWAAQQAAAAAAKADAAKRPTIQITGRIHLDYWGFPDASSGIGAFEHPMTGVDPEGRIAFRRNRIGFQGDILENMRYKLEVDFADPADANYKDMYLGFTELPVLQTVLIGNQKRPLGLDHLNSSRYNVFIERPLVVEAFNEDARRIGICSYGVSDDEFYNWRYGAYTIENSADDGAVIGDSMQLSFNARLAAAPWYDEASDGRGYLHLAVSNMVARPDGDNNPADTNSNNGRFRTRGEVRSLTRWIDTGPIASADLYDTLGTEAMFNIGPLQIVGEYQNTWVGRDVGSDISFDGGYIFAGYFLTGEHIPLERSSGTIGRVKPFQNFFLVDRCTGGTGSGWGAWQVAARYSYLDLSDDNVLGGDQNDVTFALNWWWNPYARVQFNAIYGDIRDHAPTLGYTEGHYTAIGTRFAVDF